MDLLTAGTLYGKLIHVPAIKLKKNLKARIHEKDEKNKRIQENCFERSITRKMLIYKEIRH